MLAVATRTIAGSQAGLVAKNPGSKPQHCTWLSPSRQCARMPVQSTNMPLDWDKVRQSCTANPLTASQDGRQPKVVLVTGAAGFVGMHTAMQLRKRGDGEWHGSFPVSGWQAVWMRCGAAFWCGRLQCKGLEPVGLLGCGSYSLR